MPTLHIHLLGDFRLSWDEAPVRTITAPRLHALLAYLLLHRDAPQPRHHLAFVLWPETTEAQARTNLRQLLHDLKQALPAAGLFVHTDAKTLQWRPDAPFRLDVADFEQALTGADGVEQEQQRDAHASRKALEQAIALYHGDLLPSCYDDWILPERERLRQAFTAALERLLRLLERAGQPREAICSELDVLKQLTLLVNKSLVMVDEHAEGTRYRLLETIRQYARDTLFEAGEAEQIRDRHVAFFIHLAEATEPKLRGAEQVAWLDRVESEHDNMRTALAWSLESGKSEGALRLAGALAYFWELRGYWSEGPKWLNAALAPSSREQSGRAAAGEISHPSRVEMAQRAKVLYGAGRIRFLSLFDPHTSRMIVEESLRLWCELGDKWWMAVALEHLGTLMLMAEDIQTARARLEDGVSLAREIEDRWPLALCLIRLAGSMRTDHAAARQIREEGVAVARSVGDKSVLSHGLIGLVTDHLLEGNFTAAAPVAAEALAEARAIGSATHVMLSLIQLVLITCFQGDRAKAKRYCLQVLAFARETGSPQWLLLVLFAFGVAACFSGQPRQGARLLVVAVTLLRQRGIIISDESERDLMVLRQALEMAQQLDPAAFEAARAESQQLTLEQALALATENASQDSQPPGSSLGPGPASPSASFSSP